MSVTTVTHLNFRGDARSALEFYRSALGGDLVVLTYEDAHNVTDKGEAQQVMWGQVSAENGFCVMAYDVPSRMPWARGENSFFVSLRGETADEITSFWAGLSDGATVRQPLEPAPWSPLYGMLTDRFGITWVLDVAVSYPAS